MVIGEACEFVQHARVILEHLVHGGGVEHIQNEHDDVAVLRQAEQALASDDRAGRAGVPFALLIGYNADDASSLHHDETGADDDDECPLDARPLRG